MLEESQGRFCEQRTISIDLRSNRWPASRRDSVKPQWGSYNGPKSQPTISLFFFSASLSFAIYFCSVSSPSSILYFDRFPRIAYISLPRTYKPKFNAFYEFITLLAETATSRLHNGRQAHAGEIYISLAPEARYFCFNPFPSPLWRAFMLYAWPVHGSGVAYLWNFDKSWILEWMFPAYFAFARGATVCCSNGEESRCRDSKSRELRKTS